MKAIGFALVCVTLSLCSNIAAVESAEAFVRETMECSAKDRAKVYLRHAEEMDWASKTGAPPDRRISSLISAIIEHGDFEALKALEVLVSQPRKEACWRETSNFAERNLAARKLLEYWAALHPDEVCLMRFGPEPEKKLETVLGDTKLSDLRRVIAAYELSALGTKEAVSILKKFADDKTEVNERCAVQLRTLGAIVQDCIRHLKEDQERKKGRLRKDAAEGD